MVSGGSSVGVGEAVCVGIGVVVVVKVGEGKLPGVSVDTTDEFATQPASRTISIPINTR
jgi:hypothetical protein